MDPVILLIGAVLAVILYFVFRRTPDDRVKATEAHLQAGRFPEAEKEIKWLREHEHPRAVPLLGEMYLARAKRSSGQEVLAELDKLYDLRTQFPAIAETLSSIEQQSAQVLIDCVRALAQPDEKASEWEATLAWYEQGLQRFEKTAVLRTSDAFSQCQAAAANCHTGLFRRELRPRLVTARQQQANGRYADAQRTLQAATNWLNDPSWPELQRRGAQALLPIVNTTATELAQNEQLAQISQFLDKADAQFRAATLPADCQAAFDLLTQAQQTGTNRILAGHKMLDPLLARLQATMADGYYRRAILFEKKQTFTKATADYGQSAQQYAALNKAQQEAICCLRKSIVVLKAGKGGNLADSKSIAQADAATRREYAYRAAVYLLNCERPDLAQPLLVHLKGLPQERLIKQAIQQQTRAGVRQEAETACATAIADDATFEQFTQLYDALPALSGRVAALDAADSRQLTELRPYVFGRLLLTGLAEEQYGLLLDRLTASTDFLTDAEQLKNVGIVCLRLALSQKLTLENHPRIIALWLTALYSNAVLVASLERTSWDDDYTFSLADSLGVRRGLALPDNVNFAPPSSTNISIGDTQRELAQTFESALHSIADARLQRQAVACYDEQQTALRGLIAHLNAAPQETELTPVAPGVGLLQPVSALRIVDALLAPFTKKTPPEPVLLVALPYVATPPQPLLQAYLTALDAETQLVAGLQAPFKKLQGLPALIKARAPQTKPYPQLRQRLLHRLTQDASTIHRTEPDGLLVDVFPALIEAFPDHEPFRVLGAAHLLDLVISNSHSETDKMPRSQALGHLTQASRWVPADSRVAHNLVILYAISCRDYPEEKAAEKRALLAAVQATLAYVQRQSTAMLVAAVKEELLPVQQQLYAALRSANINVDQLITAAESGIGQEQFTPTGLEMGRVLGLLRQMSAVKTVRQATTELPF